MARDMRMGKARPGMALLTQIAHQYPSKTLQDETSHHPARASFHTDRWLYSIAQCLHLCSITHVVLAVLLLLPYHLVVINKHA